MQTKYDIKGGKYCSVSWHHRRTSAQWVTCIIKIKLYVTLPDVGRFTFRRHAAGHSLGCWKAYGKLGIFIPSISIHQDWDIGSGRLILYIVPDTSISRLIQTYLYLRKGKERGGRRRGKLRSSPWDMPLCHLTSPFQRGILVHSNNQF